jgi:CRISPR-associated protein Cas1
MASQPLRISPADARQRELPDYLPARMVNEFVYCPRLFFYEWVEGVFRESADTLEGSAQHARVDRPGKGLPKADMVDESEKIHTRSIMLSSDVHRLIAKMDIVEVEGSRATPVDYKHGRPREGPDELHVWPEDRVQMAVQAMVLRENGYECDEGVLYYQTTKQKVRVPITSELIEETISTVHAAIDLASSGPIPPPLFGSPKCSGCSLAPVCLPEEVNRLDEAEPDDRQMLLFVNAGAEAPKKPAGRELRQLQSARDDLKPVYLETQGLRVGRSGGVLQVRDKERVVQEIRLNEINQLNVMGNIQVTTQAVQALLEQGVPLCYFSQGGYFYGMTSGMVTRNVFLRQKQFALAEDPWFCRKLARKLVAGKIRNQRTMLLRNHIEPAGRVMAEMKAMAERAEACGSVQELLGLEGNGARLYFSNFDGMLKAESDDGTPGESGFTLNFTLRNRRPPRDPANALLSLGYSMLARDLQVACCAVGFDPMMGFYHQPRFGRASLALDLMEPFRPLIVDSAVITAINTRMVTPGDFVTVGDSVMLTGNGRKAFYRAYELRMDTLVTHPIFDYRVSYRRLLEVQTRLLAKVLEGEIAEYPVFVTR